MEKEKEIDDKPRCGNCNFFVINPKDLSSGECRRFPPEHFMLPTPQGVADMCGFAMSRSTNWCGEYQTRVSLLS